MERCSTCTAQRIGADKASSLAQTSLHTDRTPSLGSPSIQEHAKAHPHTHSDSLEASEHPPSLHHTRRIQPLPLYQRAALSTPTEQPLSHHQPTHQPSEQAPQPPQVRSRWLWERSLLLQVSVTLFSRCSHHESWRDELSTASEIEEVDVGLHTHVSCLSLR
jgi:hypothetical protein